MRLMLLVVAVGILILGLYLGWFADSADRVRPMLGESAQSASPREGAATVAGGHEAASRVSEATARLAGERKDARGEGARAPGADDAPAAGTGSPPAPSGPRERRTRGESIDRGQARESVVPAVDLAAVPEGGRSGKADRGTPPRLSISTPASPGLAQTAISRAIAAEEAVEVAAQRGGATYVVRKGDSLVTIAREQLGSTALYRQIYEENRDRIVDPDLIYPGQELVLPSSR